MYPLPATAYNSEIGLQQSGQFLDRVPFLKLGAACRGIYDGAYPSHPNSNDPKDILFIVYFKNNKKSYFSLTLE